MTGLVCIRIFFLIMKFGILIRYCISFEIVLYLVLKIDHTEDTKSVKVACTKMKIFCFSWKCFPIY